MANPLSVAIHGKGILSTVQRGMTILGRYGLNESRLEQDIQRFVNFMITHNFRATLPVTATPMARYPQLAQKLQSQGVELAVHGLKHVDHTLLPLEDLVGELQQATRIFVEAGIHAAGFRAPYLRSNADILKALKTCGFCYDSSQALAWDMTGGIETPKYQRALEFYGAQSAAQQLALPRLEDGLVRIPYCLPDDEALVERLQLKDPQNMAEIWLAILENVYDSGELFTLGLHPERILHCRDALRFVIEKAYSLSPGVWITRLDEIAKWQRVITETSFKTQPLVDNRTRVTVNTQSRAVILTRALDTDEPSQTWAGKYRRIFSHEFTFQYPRRPWIALAPECPSALHDFLQQQGYLIETSPSPEEFSFYLQRNHFAHQDERKLLTEIEAVDWPLVRVARWPGGAKAALAITGDIDAFTIWDYGHRILNG